MRAVGLLLISTLCLTNSSTSRHSAEPISANDNQVAAGVLKDGVLSVNLEVRRGAWFPDGPAGASVDVHAFAEAGKPLLVPGPLLRVTEGTEIRATIRNTLDSALIVHGMYTRDQTARANDTIHIGPGQMRTIRFVSGQAG